MSSDTTARAAFTGVFVQTNEQGANRVLAFRRGDGGGLDPAGEYPTKGTGLGLAPGLAGIDHRHQRR